MNFFVSKGRIEKVSRLLGVCLSSPTFYVHCADRPSHERHDLVTLRPEFSLQFVELL